MGLLPYQTNLASSSPTPAATAWRSPVQEIFTEIPPSFSLEQNYPNPFNPSTTIQFALPRPIYVTLKVYNTLGKEIAILLAENLSAGKQEVVWEAKGMTSGIYFYRLQAADFVQTGKLVLVR